MCTTTSSPNQGNHHFVWTRSTSCWSYHQMPISYTFIINRRFMEKRMCRWKHIITQSRQHQTKTPPDLRCSLSWERVELLNNRRAQGVGKDAVVSISGLKVANCTWYEWKWNTRNKGDRVRELCIGHDQELLILGLQTNENEWQWTNLYNRQYSPIQREKYRPLPISCGQQSCTACLCPLSEIISDESLHSRKNKERQGRDVDCDKPLPELAHVSADHT